MQQVCEYDEATAQLNPTDCRLVTKQSTAAAVANCIQ